MIKNIFSAVGLVAIGSLVASCGSAADAPAVVPGDPTRAVPLGEWCTSAGDRVCTQLGDRCGDGSAFSQGLADGCKDSFAPGCVAGRDPASPSGRTAADLQACLQRVDAAACDQLMPATMEACSLAP